MHPLDWVMKIAVFADTAEISGQSQYESRQRIRNICGFRRTDMSFGERFHDVLRDPTAARTQGRQCYIVS